MQRAEMTVGGAWVFSPKVHGDARGSFHEWYRADVLDEITGAGFAPHSPVIAQANCSVSRAGSLRGIHFAEVPPGQAKYVTCFAGAVLDVVVDLRSCSTTSTAVACTSPRDSGTPSSRWPTGRWSAIW